MIPLMKHAFLHESETKKALAEFIQGASKLSMDEKCFEFERSFARVQRRKDAVLFNSGASANLAMLQALKNLGLLPDNATVGFSALTWSTNVMPILQLGMHPVAVDVEPATLNVMSRQFEARLATAKLDAFFVTNVLGFTGDLDRIEEICKDRGILLIEDNCEALGTELSSGRLSGNFGVMSSFSFFVAHHMSTIEGGMVVTDDAALGEMLRIVRANGWDRNLTSMQQIRLRRQHQVSSEFEAKYTFYDLGFNLRPTEITGFLGLYQLQFLEANIRKREQNYRRLAALSRQNADLLRIDDSYYNTLSNFSFPVVCRTPELRVKYFNRFSGAGVEIRPMIAGNIQRQPFYAKYVKETYDLPGAEHIHHNGFYFGNYPELTEADLETLSGCLRSY
jgi:CDP-4-dehydro-6-deoxyglucose reductase, E1